MAFRRGKHHELSIDGQTVWLDSMNEEVALYRIIEKYGFSGKWLRPKHGIKHADKYYSPDFELAIEDFSNTSRALVEVKEYRRDLTNDIIERMCAIADHYSTKDIFLYAVKKDEWHRIHRHTKLLEICDPPRPGALKISKLFTPKRYLVRSWHGRVYYQSFSDSAKSFIRKSINPTKQKYGRRRR